jgi:uncharacterized linocin/CFP29 family protein
MAAAGGVGFSSVGTGHLKHIDAPADGILARVRESKPMIELRVPFELARDSIDDVERGANDSDWQPVKDAAKKISFTEDRAIFEGYAAGKIGGIRQGTSNPIMTLPTDVRDYPDAVAQALSQLRLVGVNGPYKVLLGADAYTALAETRDHGYPVLEHVKRLVNDEIIWAPAIVGAFVDRLPEPLGSRSAALPAGNVHLPAPHHRGSSCPGASQGCETELRNPREWPG